MTDPKKRPIPEMETVEKNIADMPVAMAQAHGYDVYSWRDGLAGSDVKPSQVHLVLPVTPAISVALRLKSPRALDELVDVLLQHRADVWGERR